MLDSGAAPNVRRRTQKQSTLRIQPQLARFCKCRPGDLRLCVQQVRNEGVKVNSNINVTPMVDVMLVLLIIFMVITPMLQQGVSVDLAKMDNPVPMPDADKEDALLVAITRDGTVFFGN